MKKALRTALKKELRYLLVLLLIPLLALLPTASVSATNPQVTMTVTAGILGITNTQPSWALGYATVSEVIWFSADNSKNDTYSSINNTGSLPVDIEIQGIDFDGGDYDWTLASVNGTEQYCLYANSGNGTSTYDIEVKSLSYNDLTTNLPVGSQYAWSMKFTAPDEFNASDPLTQKSATVTLVASEHT